MQNSINRLTGGSSNFQLLSFSKSFVERHRKVSARDQTGQAMVEFVIAAITFLFTILGVIQLALVLNARTMVQYSAYNAARAGVVHGGDADRIDLSAPWTGRHCSRIYR